MWFKTLWMRPWTMLVAFVLVFCLTSIATTALFVLIAINSTLQYMLIVILMGFVLSCLIKRAGK